MMVSHGHIAVLRWHRSHTVLQKVGDMAAAVRMFSR